MYADYEFYTTKYFGELVSDTEYPKYELKARDELNYYTRMRIPFVNEDKMNKVKMCECKLIDLLYNYDQEVKKIKEYEDKSIQGVVASETVGKQSVSYQKATLRDIKVVEKERDEMISKIIRKNLSMTGLLYRGIGYVQ
ncbi:hypothetical protein [Candidatus Stoquefichus sp. SB1]|uniref:hypothetical protein n=1 Tax=Candidatus Stoquefichus sp. SB1 TaxID=1658109 RepID=UPI00067E66CC|nr:hypothetical protein [Candidatus Stoquefichus sp. SB1]